MSDSASRVVVFDHEEPFRQSDLLCDVIKQLHGRWATNKAETSIHARFISHQHSIATTVVISWEAIAHHLSPAMPGSSMS
jgi:hypothetical protein